MEPTRAVHGGGGVHRVGSTIEGNGGVRTYGVGRSNIGPALVEAELAGLDLHRSCGVIEDPVYGGSGRPDALTEDSCIREASPVPPGVVHVLVGLDVPERPGRVGELRAFVGEDVAIRHQDCPLVLEDAVFAHRDTAGRIDLEGSPVHLAPRIAHISAAPSAVVSLQRNLPAAAQSPAALVVVSGHHDIAVHRPGRSAHRDRTGQSEAPCKVYVVDIRMESACAVHGSGGVHRVGSAIKAEGGTSTHGVGRSNIGPAFVKAELSGLDVHRSCGVVEDPVHGGPGRPGALAEDPGICEACPRSVRMQHVLIGLDVPERPGRIGEPRALVGEDVAVGHQDRPLVLEDAALPHRHSAARIDVECSPVDPPSAVPHRPRRPRPTPFKKRISVASEGPIVEQEHCVRPEDRLVFDRQFSAGHSKGLRAAWRAHLDHRG